MGGADRDLHSEIAWQTFLRSTGKSAWCTQKKHIGNGTNTTNLVDKL